MKIWPPGCRGHSFGVCLKKKERRLEAEALFINLLLRKVEPLDELPSRAQAGVCPSANYHVPNHLRGSLK